MHLYIPIKISENLDMYAKIQKLIEINNLDMHANMY